MDAALNVNQTLSLSTGSLALLLVLDFILNVTVKV